MPVIHTRQELLRRVWGDVSASRRSVSRLPQSLAFRHGRLVRVKCPRKGICATAQRATALVPRPLEVRTAGPRAEEVILPRGGREVVGEGSHREGEGSLFSGILQLTILGRKEGRRLETGHRSISSEHIFGSSTLPHGNAGIHNEGSPTRGLDLLPGLEGRVSARAYVSGQSEVPTVRLRRPGIPVSSSSFRLGHGTSGVHPDSAIRGSMCSQEGHKNARVPGRLACPSFSSSGTNQEQRISVEAVRGLRARSKHPQIKSHTQTGVCLPRHSFRSSPIRVPSFRGQMGQTTEPYQEVHEIDTANSSAMAVAVGHDVLDGLASSVRTPAQEATQHSSERKVEQDQFASNGRSRSAGQVPHPLVDGEKERHGWTDDEAVQFQTGCLHGRVKTGLGSPHGLQHGLRHLASALETFSHQLARTGGSIFSPAEVRTVGEKQRCDVDVGQQDCGGLPEQTRGHSVQTVIRANKENTYLVR